MIYSQVLVSPELLNELRWPLRVTATQSEGVIVLTLDGRVAQESSGQLAKAISEAASSGDRRLVVDFEGVDYISSRGLQALDSAALGFQKSGGTLILSGIDGPVRTTFQLAALLERFTVEPSRDDAVRRLSK
jgi:anti-sigma B factor antagonist